MASLLRFELLRVAQQIAAALKIPKAELDSAAGPKPKGSPRGRVCLALYIAASLGWFGDVGSAGADT